MNLIGMYLKVGMITKYNFDIPIESIKVNCLRLTNQLWKLIPMRENNEDWHKQLETVINEIVGFSAIFNAEPLYLQLLNKLEGLYNQETEFNFYRKTVFESINLLQEISHGFGV